MIPFANKKVRNLLFLLLFVCSEGLFFGQKTINLSGTLTGNQEIVAQNEINLNSGFYYSSNNSYNLILRTDDSMILQSDTLPECNGETRALNTSLPVGSTNGQWNVTNGGTFSYAIPIFVPPGTAGMAPQISIAYSSSLYHGLLGMGWDISGLSAIVRVQQDIYHDGKTEGITLTNNDRFSLDGNRLLAVGQNGGNGTQYFTEDENFLNIYSYGVAGNGPQWFRVITRDSTIIEYGNTPDSRIEANGSQTILLWRINKIIDKHGNYMVYTYREENGESYIDNIQYTGNSNANLAPYNIIRFLYDRRYDQNKTYLAGSEIPNTVLLRTIKVECEGVLVHKYEFKYTFNYYTHLNEIIETGADGKSLNSTVINWGLLSPLMTNYETLSMSKKYVYNYGDFNGDGRTDLLVYPENYTNTSKWEMYIAQQNGHTFLKVSEGYLGENFIGFYVTDRDNDGDDDVMFKIRFKETQYNIWREQHMFYYFNGSTLVRGSNDKDFLLSFERSDLSAITRSGDFDGNGTTDYLFVLRSDTNELQPEDYFQCVGLNLSGTPNFLNPEKTEIIDFNGNGKKDILALYTQGMKVFEYNSNTRVFDCIYTNETFPQNTNNFFTGDFNGDGNTDFVGLYSGNLVMRYSTGTTLIAGIIPSLTGNKFVNDYNGDGRDDILCLFNNASDYAEFDVYYSTGLSFQKEISILNTSLNTTYDESFGFGDFNGDGKKDMIFHPLNTSTYTLRQFVFHEYEKNHFVHKITDGFNNTIKIIYDYLSYGCDFYSKSYDVTFPYKVFQNDMLVVKSIDQPDGIGGRLTTNYAYKGATMHLQARGFLGFMEITSINPVINVKSTKKSRLNITCAVLEHYKTEKRTSNDYLLSDQIYHYKYYDYGSKRYFVYLDTIKVNDYINNSTNIQITEYDLNGNLLSKKTNYPGESYTEVNYSQYTLPNKPGKIINTTIQNGNSFTKETTLQYDNKGRLISLIDFSNLDKKIKTEFTYDAFGNIRSSTISAPNYANLEPRSSSTDYDVKGRFPVKYINALGFVMQYSYDPATGAVLMETDQNNLSTTNFYDGLGRVIKKVSPTGIESTFQFGWYSGSQINAKYYISLSQPGSPGETQYFDCLGRNVRQETKSFDGTLVYKETVYDQKGQVWKKNLPFLNGYQYITYTYDSIGRIISESGPGTSITYNYSGRTVTLKNTGVTPNLIFTKTYNTLGQLIQATDAGGTIIYTYHPSGQILQVQAPGSTQKIDYDEYGKQKYLFDPDADTVFYGYNAYGELIWQKDARNNIISLTYDKLGRILTKTTSDGTIAYSYDSQPNGKGKAAVISSSNGSSYTYFYDNYSRVVKIEEAIPGHNGALTTYFTFNDLNQQTEITYPSGFKISNLYNNFGFLKEVQVASSQQTIWKANSVNILGLPENYQFGNNITTIRTYDMYGNPTGIKTTQSGNTIQNLKYEVEPFTGNLIMRKDEQLGLTETFQYDNLNRLVLDSIANRPGQHITYNNYGNILTKTGTGEYTYDVSKPHAVSTILGNDGSIPGTQCNITYNSTNKISSIIDSLNSVLFYYNVADMRNKVVSVINGISSTKFYSLGLYEEVVIGTKVRKLHYIYAGDGLAAIYVMNSASDTMYYIHKDHLGSFDAITNNRNNAVERLSFDAWGRRRNATDWTYNNVPATFLFDRGFTGHEHMDAFGLINANGRIYDPCMGRFLSPDIVVQSPDFTQDYNRYSYAINNPLKYSDPSGYSRPPDFNYYWNEYLGITRQAADAGYWKELLEERAGITDFNAWWIAQQHNYGPGFYDLYVRDVNGNWIRKQNAVDVTGMGDYVSRDEVYTMYDPEIIASFFTSVKEYSATGNKLLSFVEINEDFYAVFINSSGDINCFLRLGKDVIYVNPSGQGGGNEHLSGIEIASTINGAVDKTGTLTSGSIYGAQKVAGIAAKDMTKLTAMTVLGRVTGVTSAFDNARKFYNDPSGNWFNGVEAVGQVDFMLFGGEEAELIYNLSTMTIDLTIDVVNAHNKNKQ